MKLKINFQGFYCLKFRKVLTLFFLSFCLGGYSQEVANSISLKGIWEYKLDSLNIGKAEKWQDKNLGGEFISLPGTLDDAGIGRIDSLQPALNNYVLSNLHRKHEYYGKVWYQKEVTIPKNWNDKRITLRLERVLWQSVVYIDGKLAGTRESLIGNHVYNLTNFLNPGNHLITMVIDNSNLYPKINVTGDKYPDKNDKEMAHAYTNHTQIIWNGILGNISLNTTSLNAPRNLQVYPDIINDSIGIVFIQDKKETENIRCDILDSNDKKLISTIIKNPVITDTVIKFSIRTPKNIKKWDEFSPKIYTAKLYRGKDTISSKFGFRQVRAKNGELTLNGHRIFLRGNLECVIFPLTGHPPMKKEAWASLIKMAKNYGLNHLRFHSWCPPKEAFEAADEAGFYFQVELPHWSLHVGADKNTTNFLYSEAYKILKDYGNHPSFIMMSMGNELEGDMQVLNNMVRKLKNKDNRHLYTTTTFSFQKPAGTRPEPEDQYFIGQWTKKGWIRGQGIFNDHPPSFDEDYSENIDFINVPVISHEIGQYSVYPDLKEIPKYNGVLEPLNFMAIQNDLKEKGLLNLASDFTQASGKLAAILYKEEIERALKTPEFDGFQLLQLQDYPGQGTALVGLLNAFWESKGIITGKEFREFNSEIVPLMRFKKAVYKTGEDFKAIIEVADFYKQFKNQKISWNISDSDGKIIRKDEFVTDLNIGNNEELDSINLQLNTVKAQKFKISLELNGTPYHNSWSIWVYPDINIQKSSGIVVTDSFEVAKKALREGKKVFLNPKPDNIIGVKGRFVPVFWSPVHFPDQPGTMGLLIDKDNPALKDFPTSDYTEWNWWDLCIQSKSVNINTTGLKPVVRVIDNFVTNRSLANVFEAKVGNGSLLFTSIDLQTNLENRPVAKQLKYSLLNYMNTAAFHPDKTVSLQFLDSIEKK